MRDYQRKPFAPLFEKSGLLPPTRHDLNAKILSCLYYDSDDYNKCCTPPTAGAITRLKKRANVNANVHTLLPPMQHVLKTIKEI